MENFMKIKPGEAKTLPIMVDLKNGCSFPIENDNGVLLALYGDTSGEVTVEGGDGVLAGGNKVIAVDSSEYKFFYLESGRYAKQEDGKTVVRVSANYNGINGMLIQLA